MIINIRGTHGSGKSWIVKQLLNRYEAIPESTDAKGKPLGYVMQTYAGSLYVVGPYENACGGCDTIQPYADIWPRVVAYATKGHVVFEGALVSSSYGNIGRFSETYGNDFVFVFLDTPLQVCLDRIQERRRQRGDDRPVDPRNTEVKYLGVLKSIPKIRDELNRRIVVLNYLNPLPQLLGVLYDSGRQF